MENHRFDIELISVGKKFRYDWIFKNINIRLSNDNSYAVLGPNGIGKSTLMKVLSSHLSPTVGSIHFKQNDQEIDINEVYKSISFAAPYIDLIDELDINELLKFHFSFKKLHREVPSIKECINLTNLTKIQNKPIKYYSSGMKQRLKLCLAMCTESSLVLFDEPTSNLDKQGIAWFQQMIDSFKKDRIVVIASNTEHDYEYCNQFFNISDYK